MKNKKLILALVVVVTLVISLRSNYLSNKIESLYEYCSSEHTCSIKEEYSYLPLSLTDSTDAGLIAGSMDSLNLKNVDFLNVDWNKPTDWHPYGGYWVTAYVNSKTFTFFIPSDGSRRITNGTDERKINH